MRFDGPRDLRSDNTDHAHTADLLRREVSMMSRDQLRANIDWCMAKGLRAEAILYGDELAQRNRRMKASRFGGAA